MKSAFAAVHWAVLRGCEPFSGGSKITNFSFLYRRGDFITRHATVQPHSLEMSAKRGNGPSNFAAGAKYATLHAISRIFHLFVGLFPHDLEDYTD